MTQASTQSVSEAILAQLTRDYPELSPQLQRAARYLLDHPNEIGVNSMRQIAATAGVHPNTLVRLARALDFDSFEAFRRPFQEELLNSRGSFPDRVRWLQSLAQGHSHGQLFSQMAAACLANIEHLFAGTSAEELKTVADRIVASETTYILGVGVFYSLAHNFWYVTRMALDNLLQVPRPGNLPMDDLVKIGSRDVLLAMTFAPFRSEVVEATRLARERGATVVAITDARSSPIARIAHHAFIASSATPHFFTSHLAPLALLETLTAFIIADADPGVIAKIEEFHRKRFEAGVYWTEPE